MSLGLVFLEKLFTRMCMQTPQSDTIMSHKKGDIRPFLYDNPT